VKGLKAHDNAGDGLYIGTNGPVTCTDGGLYPSYHVQVIGGIFAHNGHSGLGSGITITGAAGVPDHVPADIQLNGVLATLNSGYGIEVDSGWDVSISRPSVSLNGNYGIIVQNPSNGGVLVPQQTERIRIADADVFNNAVGNTINGGIGGIGINSVDHVTVSGATLSNSILSPSNQTRGVDVQDRLDAGCTAIRLSDIDVAPYSDPRYPFPVCSCPDFSAGGCAATPCTPAASGFYRLQGHGNPDAGLAAPVGSEFIDLDTGTVYRKTSGTSASGWQTP
jgi:hypothetical protein